MVNIIKKHYDNLGQIEKKIIQLVGAKLRDKDSIRQAMKTQDGIRKKYKTPVDWDSVSLIRRWREQR